MPIIIKFQVRCATYEYGSLTLVIRMVTLCSFAALPDRPADPTWAVEKGSDDGDSDNGGGSVGEDLKTQSSHPLQFWTLERIEAKNNGSYSSYKV